MKRVGFTHFTKAVLCCIAAIALVLSGAFGSINGVSAETIVIPKPLELGKTYEISVNSFDYDPAVYSFNAARSGEVTIEIRASKSVDVSLIAEDGKSVYVLWNIEYDGNWGSYYSIKKKTVLGGNCYLKLGGHDANNVDVNFSLTFKESSESFIETQAEHYDYYENAQEVEFFNVYRGFFAGENSADISINDVSDMYKFSVEKDSSYTVFVGTDEKISSGDKTIGVIILDSAHNVVFQTSETFTGTGKKVFAADLAKGQYYMIINSPGTKDGFNYRFKLNIKKPVITSESDDCKTICGSKAKFTVKAEGDDLSYRWYVSVDGKKWAKSSSTGYNTATLSVRATKTLNGRMFKCVVSNKGGSTTSRVFNLTTLSVISKQPANVKVNVGDTSVFSVKSRSSVAVYQWQISNDGGKTWHKSNAAGNNTNTVSFTASKTMNGNKYRCKVTNGNWVEYSAVRTVTVKK